MEHDLAYHLFAFSDPEEDELMLTHLDVVPGDLCQEGVHLRSVRGVYVEVHRRVGRRCARKEVVCRFAEDEDTRLGLQGSKCADGRHVWQELLQEVLWFVCHTKVGGGDGPRGTACL